MDTRTNLLQREKEARLVEGTYNKDRRAESELYTYCSDYYWANYPGVFFADEKTAKEIHQETFITFWEKIEHRVIYAGDHCVLGKDGKPMTASILTYFMAIAKLKYKEWAKSHISACDPEKKMEKAFRKEEFDAQQYASMLYDSEDNRMLEIIADIISHMKQRCRDILSKFYYEGKDLDTILKEIPSITSKDALKTQKYKCMKSLRDMANDMYNDNLNS